MLSTCSEYSDVILADIPKLAQTSSATILASRIESKIRAETEAFFNAFLYNWDIQGPCRFPTGERVCGGQRPRIFRRNNVGICYTYTLYILTIYLVSLYRMSF